MKARRSNLIQLARNKHIVYSAPMIKGFADKATEKFFETGKSKRLPPAIINRAAMRLNQLDSATVVEDLRLPPSNQLEALSGDRKGQWSIKINDRWRICFIFENGHAHNVEIVDYH